MKKTIIKSEKTNRVDLVSRARGGGREEEENHAQPFGHLFPSKNDYTSYMSTSLRGRPRFVKPYGCSSQKDPHSAGESVEGTTGTRRQSWPSLRLQLPVSPPLSFPQLQSYARLQLKTARTTARPGMMPNRQELLCTPPDPLRPPVPDNVSPLRHPERDEVQVQQVPPGEHSIWEGEQADQ